jgi:hypothetical protein
MVSGKTSNAGADGLVVVATATAAAAEASR